MRPVPVYDAATLNRGASIAGPCLVEASTFTALLRPGHRATMDQGGNLLVDVS
jgi:N-methylhydantoinase A